MFTKTLALLLTTAMVAVLLEMGLGIDLGVTRVIDAEATRISRDVSSLIPDVSFRD